MAPWLAALVVGGVTLVIGAIAAYVGIQKLSNEPAAGRISAEGQGGCSVDQGQDELEQKIAEKRENVAEGLSRLEDKLKQTTDEARARTDWRNGVESRPLAFLGAALGVGLYLGLTLGAYIRVSIPGLTPAAASRTAGGYSVYLPPDVMVSRAG